MVYAPKEVYVPYKEAWYVGLGQERVLCVRLGGTVSNTLKEGGIEREEEKQKF